MSRVMVLHLLDCRPYVGFEMGWTVRKGFSSDFQRAFEQRLNSSETSVMRSAVKKSLR
jgi:hypothetical protein